MTFAPDGCREDSSLRGATGSAEVRWEPTLSAMGACLDLARCRGIADKVGSHQNILERPAPRTCMKNQQKSPL